MSLSHPSFCARVTLGLCIAACTGPHPEDAASFDTVGTSPRVLSTAPAEQGAWALVEEIRIALDETPAGASGFVRDIALFEDGTIAVAGLGPAALHLFDAKGTWLRTIGREGAGPGEFQDAFLAVRGDTLIVQDRRNARALWFLRDGTPVRQHPTACCLTEGTGVDSAGRVIVPATAGREGRKDWIRATRGELLDTLTVRDDRYRATPVWQVELPGGGGFGKMVPFLPAVRTAIHPHGGLVVGWSGEMLLRRTTNGTDTALLYGRPREESRRLTSSERALLAATLARADAAVEQLDASLLVAAYDPELLPLEPEAFDAIWVDPVGRTWVQRGSLSDTAIVRLDLYDERGVWLDVVELPAAGWSRAAYFRPMSWTRRHVAVAAQADEGMVVIRYRVERRR